MPKESSIAALGVAMALTFALAACSAPTEATDAPTSATPAPTSDPPAPSKKPRPKRATTAPVPDITVPSLSLPPSSRGMIFGGDASWPQCPKGMGIPERRTLGAPMPLPTAEYVVLGLTNGPGFTENPCLADQVAWVRERRLMAAAYAVASLPDGDDLAEHGGTGPYDAGSARGQLANAGYQQALGNVATMRRAGLTTPMVWVDVEPVPDFEWSGDPVANSAVVEGSVRAYEDAGYRVGVYSTPALWRGVVGGLRLGLPEWRAAGETSRQEALSRCGRDWSIQGGRAVLGQWVELNRDQNVTCPGIATDLARWFHQY